MSGFQKKSVVTNLVLPYVWFSKKVSSDKFSITLCLFLLKKVSSDKFSITTCLVFKKKSVVTNLVLPHFLLFKKIGIAQIIVIEKSQ